MALSRVTESANHLLVHDSDLKSSQRNSELRNIRPIIRKVIEMKKAEFSETKNISLTLKDPIKSSSIMSDIPTEPLYNIISNAINNSYDAIDGDGSIVVSIKSVNQQLIIEIEDTGKGIPDSEIQKIWNLGYSYKKRKGNGLGLGHAKKVIENHWNGLCYCTSTLGVGTKVGFKFPQNEIN